MRSDREGKVDAANPRSASLVYDHLVDLRAFLGRDVDAYTASRLSRPLTGGGAILFAPFDSRPVLLGPVLFRRSILLRCPICPILRRLAGRPVLLRLVLFGRAVCPIRRLTGRPVLLVFRAALLGLVLLGCTVRRLAGRAILLIAPSTGPILFRLVLLCRILPILSGPLTRGLAAAARPAALPFVTASASFILVLDRGRLFSARCRFLSRRTARRFLLSYGGAHPGNERNGCASCQYLG